MATADPPAPSDKHQLPRIADRVDSVVLQRCQVRRTEGLCTKSLLDSGLLVQSPSGGLNSVTAENSRMKASVPDGSRQDYLVARLAGIAV